MKGLVIGLGISGLSAARLLLRSQFTVKAIDRRADELFKNTEVQSLIKEGVELCASHHCLCLQSFDLVVVSPGVAPDHPAAAAARKMGIEVIGEIELACRFLSHYMIGVTGTNGKTTVTKMIGHVLNVCGIPARVLGNGGVALSSEVQNLKGEVVVCELSSFQLETMTSKVINVGAILNITPDHLDRYSDMESYAKAKWKLLECIKPNGKIYVSEQVKRKYGNPMNCVKENIEFLCFDHYKSPLNHDEENYFAAKAVCLEAGVAPLQFDQAVKSFQKPPHRIEFVRKLRGVYFYNDSKGTNLDAVVRAVESMPGPVVLIAGGKDKGIEFDDWCLPFKGKVKIVIAIGEASGKIFKDLNKAVPVIFHNTLESAVKKASSIANEGDNVLLSPGCASFDMFKDFEERGNCFKECVWLLE